MTSDQPPLEILRSQGWAVAVHNDYFIKGERFTFWLFTHPEGIWIKGEGKSDAEALDPLPPAAYEALRELREARLCVANSISLSRWAK